MIGAVTNLIINLILIPFFWSIGAIIGSLSAELVIDIAMILSTRKQIDFKPIFLSSWKCCVSGLIMFICVFLTQHFLNPSILNTLLLILEGVAIYFALLIALKQKVLLTTLHDFWNKLFSKRKGK